MSKETKNSLREKKIDVHKLLIDIDNFLVSIPPAEWRRRASDQLVCLLSLVLCSLLSCRTNIKMCAQPLGDMPLRTCKTILQQVVVVFGPNIVEELESMQLDEASFVGAYLHRLASMQSQSPSAQSQRSPQIAQQPSRSSGFVEQQQSLRPRPSFSGPPPSVAMQSRDSVVSASTARSIPHKASQSSLSPSSADAASVNQQIDEREINQQLKEIFDTIGQPETSKQASASSFFST